VSYYYEIVQRYLNYNKFIVVIMDWKKEWSDKHIFVQLNKGAVYSGKVIDVDDSNSSIVFITIIDKYGNKVTFLHSEILKILEEKR